MPKKSSKQLAAKRRKRRHAIAKAIRKATKSGAYEVSEHLTSELDLWK
jgi:ribosomal protein L32